jgi:hypothetical protein
VCKVGAVAFIDNPTYKLRVHAGQISAIAKADGGLNAIKLQRDLLRVARRHAPVIGAARGLASHDIGTLLGRLCSAAAQPLLAYDGDNLRRRRLFPRKARKYLAYALAHGYPLRALYVVSFLPKLARRLYFAFDSRFHHLRSMLRRSRSKQHAR